MIICERSGVHLYGWMWCLWHVHVWHGACLPPRVHLVNQVLCFALAMTIAQKEGWYSAAQVDGHR